MNRVKKVNLLFCFVFSFISLFGNIFPVQAATDITDIHLYEDQVLEQALDPKYPNGEVAVCKFTYITVNNGEQEIIWMIKDIAGWVRNRKRSDDYFYRLLERKSNHEISNDGTSAKIFLTIERRKGYLCEWLDGKFDLTFEFKVN